jgi:hypothetical protein
MKIFLVSVVTLLFVLLELLAGNWLLPLSMPVYTAVYFAIAYRKSTGIFSAAAAGLIIDAVYGREWMLLMLIFPGVVMLILPVVRYFRRRMPLAPLAAGVCAGAAGFTGTVLLCLLCSMEIPGPDIFSMLVFQSVIGGSVMLLFTVLADFLAFKCNLPRFIITGTDPRRVDNE